MVWQRELFFCVMYFLPQRKLSTLLCNNIITEESIAQASDKAESTKDRQAIKRAPKKRTIKSHMIGERKGEETRDTRHDRYFRDPSAAPSWIYTLTHSHPQWQNASSSASFKISAFRFLPSGPTTRYGIQTSSSRSTQIQQITLTEEDRHSAVKGISHICQSQSAASSKYKKSHPIIIIIIPSATLFGNSVCHWILREIEQVIERDRLWQSFEAWRRHYLLPQRLSPITPTRRSRIFWAPARLARF